MKIAHREKAKLDLKGKTAQKGMGSRALFYKIKIVNNFSYNNLFTMRIAQAKNRIKIPGNNQVNTQMINV